MQNHHASIINAKPRLNTWNRTFVAVHEVHRNNRRTNRVEEARKMQIQKENQILIDKMAKTFLRNPSKELSPANAQTYPNSHHNPPAQHSTLNFLVRKRERDRILRDNLVRLRSNSRCAQLSVCTFLLVVSMSIRLLTHAPSFKCIFF